jgi:hypothetical protein
MKIARHFCSILARLGVISTNFNKSYPTSNVIKIRPVGIQLIHAGRHTDRQNDEAKRRFLRTHERLKNEPEFDLVDGIFTINVTFNSMTPS